MVAPWTAQTSLFPINFFQLKHLHPASPQRGSSRPFLGGPAPGPRQCHFPRERLRFPKSRARNSADDKFMLQVLPERRMPGRSSVTLVGHSGCMYPGMALRLALVAFFHQAQCTFFPRELINRQIDAPGIARGKHTRPKL